MDPSIKLYCPPFHRINSKSARGVTTVEVCRSNMDPLIFLEGEPHTVAHWSSPRQLGWLRKGGLRNTSREILAAELGDDIVEVLRHAKALRSRASTRAAYSEAVSGVRPNVSIVTDDANISKGDWGVNVCQRSRVACQNSPSTCP